MKVSATNPRETYLLHEKMHKQMADRYLLLLLLLFLYINCIFVGLQRKQESKEKAQKDTYYDDERRNEGEQNVITML